jgi:energy-coupling factor transport system ATP-binding protein
MTGDALIEIRELTHVYQPERAGAVKALRGISLTIGAGEWVALVGANGSGKTTLARHLNALLLPTEGVVRVAGQDTREQSHWRAIRATVGMVFQIPADQIVSTVVEEDVAFGPENLGVPRAELKQRVREALEQVGMWERRNRPPHLLSPGQQQRVAIAGALAMQPKCLVLDEATAMLDPAGRRELWRIVETLHRQGLTIIAITHDMDEAARAQRVIALSQGQAALDATPAEVFADPGRVRALGLELPSLAALGERLGLSGTLMVDNLAAAIKRRYVARSGGVGCARRKDADGVSRVNAEGANGADAPTTNGEPLITVRGLRHTYMAGTPFATEALRGVDFELRAGEAVGLIGGTGAGKSTLLQHLNGLYRPQAGQVCVLGLELGDLKVDVREARRQVGLAFQRPEQQLFAQYVGDDVAYGPRALGLSGEALRERVKWAMALVGLDFLAYKDRLTWTLSGGEQRKAALAGVLALRPRVLLLDEPTAGLDPQSREDLLDRLNGLRAEGIALVIAAHNMEDIARLTERVYVLSEGQVAICGPTRGVLAQGARLRELGLDAPPAVNIAEALRARGIGLPVDALTLDELALGIQDVLTQPVPEGDEQIPLLPLGEGRDEGQTLPPNGRRTDEGLLAR